MIDFFIKAPEECDIGLLASCCCLQLDTMSTKSAAMAIDDLNFMYYIVSCATKFSNLTIVSSIETSDLPPAALRCPPPLK